MSRKGPNGKYLPKKDDCPFSHDDLTLKQMGFENHRDMINYLRAEKSKTWPKPRHYKKYIGARIEAELAEERLLRYAY